MKTGKKKAAPNAMQPWFPDANPYQTRRIGKTMEELGELLSVLARITIQGMDEVDPASGKTNRQRMEEETADVLAQLQINIKAFKMSQIHLVARQLDKTKKMEEWEEHFTWDERETQ